MLKPCEEWNERISAYLDEECTKRECAEVERHLADCPACRAVAELYRCDAQDAAATLAKRGASDGFAENVLLAVMKTVEEERKTEKAVTGKDIERAFSGEALAPKRRKGFRWAEGFVVTIVMAMVVAIFFPVTEKAREKAFQSNCMNNQRQLVAAIQMLAMDNEEVFPPLDNWVERVNLDPKVFHCTQVKRRAIGEIDYAYNANVAGRALEEFSAPHATIVTFDAKNGAPAYRHGPGMIASYADGHVAMVTPAAEEKENALHTSLPEPATITPPVKNYGLADKLQIAYRASVSLESADVQGAMEKAELLFRRYDGFVLTSNYQRGEEGKATAAVSGRVPSGKLGEMLVEIDGLGTLTSRNVNGDDLTAAHLENLEKLSNLAGAQGNLERIGGGARKTGDALTVETRRGAAASEASGSRVEEYKLRSRVTLAEISISITSKPKPVVEQPKRPVQDAFVGSLKALRAFGNWLAVVFVALLPWLIMLGIVLGPIYGAWYVRRRGKK